MATARPARNWLNFNRIGSTTQQQVAAVVVGSVLLAHAVSFLVLWAIFRAQQTEPLQTIGPTYANILGSLYDAEQTGAGDAGRAVLLQTAAQNGVRLHPLDTAAIAPCKAVQQHPPPPDADAQPATGLKLLTCTPALPGDVRTVFQTPAGSWLGVSGARNWAAHHGPPPHPRYLFIGLAAVTIATTMLLCLWASRRVTAPLRRLAETAEQVDPERGGTVLPSGGTLEIRLLADSFNRLIVRLKAFGDDQRRLVAGVSHDLRTPLTRLKLRLDQVTDPALRERLARDVQTMQIIVDSSLSLISAQQSGVTRRDVDLGALLATIADGYADAGENVTLEGPLHLPVRCDPTMITRAVENLVENAIKFAGSAQIGLSFAAQAAIIEVTDHGPGISDDQKPRVFEAFYRGDDSRGLTPGTGLGLAITKAVVTAHGGAIRLLDALPTGLTVRIEVPRL